MLEAFVNGVPPAALADVVLCNMAHLPPHPPPTLVHTHMAAPAAAAATVARLGGVAGPGGMRAASPSPPPPGWPGAQGQQGQGIMHPSVGQQQLYAPVPSAPGAEAVGVWGAVQPQPGLGAGTPPLPLGAGRAERSPPPELLFLQQQQAQQAQQPGQHQAQQPGQQQVQQLGQRPGAAVGGGGAAQEAVYRLPLPKLAQLARGASRHLRPGEAPRPADLPPSAPPTAPGALAGTGAGDGFGAGTAARTGGPLEALILLPGQQTLMRDAAVSRILGCAHMPRLQVNESVCVGGRVTGEGLGRMVVRLRQHGSELHDHYMNASPAAGRESGLQTVHAHATLVDEECVEGWEPGSL